jgi:hypothetical protein
MYGGTCECKGGCEKSDKGPWNDFDPVFPVGCKPKRPENQELRLSEFTNLE